MKLGIFAKTFSRPTIEEVFQSIARQSGFTGPIIMHGLEEMDVAFSREFLRQTLAYAGFIL